ncbi:hypothetical protein Dip510_000915 [Elusimicrobium posterum]|uniref:hypothetical protein n=1 Tax=Elusimicrobium posterum TaxID=3116653 RepID=UPI003C70897A
MKRTALLGIVVVLTCACGQSSLSYRKDVNHFIAAGHYDAAEAKVEEAKGSIYKEKDSLLYYLDLGLVQHDAHKPAESDANFALAQQRIDELFTKSISANVAKVVKNDTTTPYDGAEYEKAMTYVYRALNFLERNDLQGALVEARKAVFNLDYLRKHKKTGYNDDPFVQYFASLLFEMEGNLSSARIARANALSAYERFAPFYSVSAPNFAVPQNADKMGEIIFIHYNGHIPQLTSRTMQIAWDRALLVTSESDELLNEDASVQNAVIAGIAGNAITIAYPVMTSMPYYIQGSNITAAGITQDTVLMHDLAALAQKELSDDMPGIMARLIARAAIKQVLNVQAQNVTKSLTDDDNLAMLAGMLVRGLSAAVEKADTRMWFTLPAEVRMSRLFIPPGKHTVVFTAYDHAGSKMETHNFDVELKAGERIFLHHRTAK